MGWGVGVGGGGAKTPVILTCCLLTRSPLSSLGDEVNLESSLLENLERVERLGDEETRLMVAQVGVSRSDGDQSTLGYGGGGHG